VESNGRPDNRPRSTSQVGEGTCIRCVGLMIKEYYLDLQDDTGQIGITGLRCTSCGEVIDPVILKNRLDRTLSLLHVVRKRKYAQRVDQDTPEGQGRNGHGSDKRPSD
jgi:hypothetical protein